MAGRLNPGPEGRHSRWAAVALSLATLALLLAAAAYFVERGLTLWVRLPLAVALFGYGLGFLLDPTWLLRQWQARAIRFSTHTLLTLGAFTGVLVLVNVLPYWFPQRWDWTQDRRNTLAPEIQEVLRQLPQPVTAYAFFTPRNNPEPARKLLEDFAFYAQGRFRYQIVDPIARPGLAQQYGVTRDGTVVLVMGERWEQVEFLTEEEMARTLIRLMHPERRVVAFLTGHGERNPDAPDPRGYALLKQDLEAKNYQVRTLDLALEGYQVPEEVTVVVLADPQQPLEPQEVQALKAFALRGGGLVMFLNTPLESPQAPGEGLEAFLAQQWGLVPEDTVVVDTTSPQPHIALAGQYGEHVITQKMQGWRTYFPLARSLNVADEAPEEVGLVLTPLVFTADRAWGETDLEALKQGQGGQVAFDPQTDRPGPLVLAVAAERNDWKARLVLVGDADFASNAYYTDLGNGVLALNSVDWVAEEEDLLQVTPRERIRRQLVVPNAALLNLLALTTVVLLPMSVLGMGLGVWLYRRFRG